MGKIIESIKRVDEKIREISEKLVFGTMCISWSRCYGENGGYDEGWLRCLHPFTNKEHLRTANNLEIASIEFFHGICDYAVYERTPEWNCQDPFFNIVAYVFGTFEPSGWPQLTAMNAVRCPGLGVKYPLIIKRGEEEYLKARIHSELFLLFGYWKLRRIIEILMPGEVATLIRGISNIRVEITAE